MVPFRILTENSIIYMYIYIDKEDGSKDDDNNKDMSKHTEKSKNHGGFILHPITKSVHTCNSCLHSSSFLAIDLELLCT